MCGLSRQFGDETVEPLPCRATPLFAACRVTWIYGQLPALRVTFLFFLYIRSFDYL